MMYLRLATIIALALVATCPAQGAIIAAWDFLNDVQPAADDRDPNTLDPGMTSTQGLTRGSGLTATSLVRSFSSGGWEVGNQNDAVADNQFITFELAPQTGTVASYSTLDYKVRRSSAGANAFIWQYRVGGGSFEDVETETSYTGTDSNGLFFQDDLSSIAALQNVTDSVTFRFVGWGGTDGTLAFGRNGSGVAGDTLIVSGTVVAIPEPAGCFLMASGSMLCLLCRRQP